MKYYLMICFSFLPFLSGANDWQHLLIGDEVFISLPAGVDISGIHNLYNFSLNLDNGRIIVNRHSIDVPLHKIGEFGIESYAMGAIGVLEMNKNFEVTHKRGIKISGIPAYTFQFIDDNSQLNQVIHLYYKGYIYSFKYVQQDDRSINEERDKFFQSIHIKNQFNGDWEVYDQAGKYQFILSLSDSVAYKNFYSLKMGKRFSSPYFKYDSRKCFSVNPLEWFYLGKIQNDSLLLDYFKYPDSIQTTSFYGLRANFLIPKFFNYNETLVNIELPEAEGTIELLMV